MPRKTFMVRSKELQLDHYCYFCSVTLPPFPQIIYLLLHGLLFVSLSLRLSSVPSLFHLFHNFSTVLSLSLLLHSLYFFCSSVSIVLLAPRSFLLSSLSRRSISSVVAIVRAKRLFYINVHTISMYYD